MTRLVRFALVSVLLAGCAPSGTAVTSPTPSPDVASESITLTPPPERSTSEEPDAPATASSAAESPPPRPPLYTAPPDEVLPQAKQVAARAAQQLVTYDVGTRAADLTGAVTEDPDRQAVVAQAIEPLVDPTRWSRGRVVYPQLGGVSTSRASVMVVVELRQGTGAHADEVVTRTFDVRLLLVNGTWAFDELASIGGTPVPRPAGLSELAASVLDDPRIELPDSARWDIHAGEVAEPLLRTMRKLADRTPFGVVTLSRGHPFNVFGTDRQSNHTRGRAVDIYRTADTLVVDDRTAPSSTHDTVTWLYDLPQVSELGSPWALDGYGGRSFTDRVHQDHIHIGTTPDGH